MTVGSLSARQTRAHVCKIDTLDPDRNNRHKQNQELGWGSCIMNIFRKLFRLRTFQGETWKINDERGKLLMNTTACSAIQWESRQILLSTSSYTRWRRKFVDVYQIWWRICLSRFRKRSETKIMKIFRGTQRRIFRDDIEISKSKNCFCLSCKSFSEIFSCFCIIPPKREFIDSSRSLENVFSGNFFLAFFLSEAFDKKISRIENLFSFTSRYTSQMLILKDILACLARLLPSLFDIY